MERNRGGRPRHPDILTPAEWRVLEALREGGTNAEIAVRLGISPDTVKYHISNMLGKLGVSDRRELAAWQPGTTRRHLPALFAAPAALGSMVRPVAWVAVGAFAVAAVAVVAVAIVALSRTGDAPVAVAPPPTEATAPSPPPTQPPTPTPTPPATPTPLPPPEATQVASTPVATPEATPSPSQTPATQSEAPTFRYDAFGTDPPVAIRTVLQPGLNLAGWTEPDAGVSAIFDAIPDLAYVYAWDADEQWFRWATRIDSGVVGDLETLTPGMGLWLDVAGDQAVTWERLLIPQSGLAELREGWNLIVWAGDDGIATPAALRHLDGIVMATLDADGARPATLTRGAAFWLRASADKQWWQLDPPPRVEFVSDHTPAQQEALHAWVDDVVAYYARRFGHGVPGLVIRFGDDAVFSDEPNGPCGRYVRPIISMKARCPDLLAHEYAHAVQRYLAPAGSHGPLWLTEGVAERWFGQYVEAGGGRSYSERVRDTIVPNARSLAAPLEVLEAEGRIRGELNYSVAELAVGWLASQAGESALYGYYASRAEHAGWEGAFRSMFGFTIADFYEGFETFREEGAPPSPLVKGKVLGADGKPVTGIWVNFANVLGGRDLKTKTDAEGNFDVNIRRGSTVLTLLVDLCSLRWSSSDTRIQPVTSASGRIDTNAGAVAGLVLTLLAPPSEQCGLIEGSLTDPAGNPRAAGYVTVSPTSRSRVTDDRLTTWFWRFPRSNGGFSFYVPKARYRIAVWMGQSLGYFGGESGFTTLSGDATVLDLGTSDITDIVIPFAVVSGTVLGSDGEPIEGIYVLEPSQQNKSRGIPHPTGLPMTDGTGTFRLVLPRGAHTLEFECLRGGGGWYGGDSGFTSLGREATPIIVDVSDVMGIVINAPFTQADVDASTASCPPKEPALPVVTGVILGTDGEIRTGLRLMLSDSDIDHIKGYTRDLVTADDEFRIKTLSEVDYLYIRLDPDESCIPGLEGDGEWIALGRTIGDGRFTPATDLPEGVSVEGADIQSIVVRVPDPCP